MANESVFGSALVFDSVRGEFINSMHQRVAEILADYDPALRLMYIPQAERTAADTMPFAVGHVSWGQEPNIIMFLREDEVNETLLARIWMNDSRKNDPMAYLEKLEAAQQAMKYHEDLEKREEAKEKAEFMLRSPKHTMNLGGGRVLHT